MQVYLYDDQGQYVGPYVAQESPLEPGVHITPVNSTSTAPPSASANQVAMFADGAWSVVADYRGQTWFDQTTGTPIEITAVGEPANNLAATLPPSQLLANAKAYQCAEMEAAYVAAVGAPIDYMGTTFQADDYSRTVLNQTLTAADGALPSGFQWYDINNAGVVMTFVQLQGLAASILSRGQPLFVNKQVKKAAINSATSVTAVQAITF